ncbi:hypothetical protein F5887DRAFT_190044 [Amanita rubescens]|nr:hypothetical protein F5887DRAFT_190044 [Amanita rubescens]
MDGSGYCDAKLKRQKLCQETEGLQYVASGTMQQPSKDTSHFPINRLPRDVLAEIFVQCLPEVILWPRISNVGYSTKKVAPLLLCNVCSSWRALALSIPRLWQDLFLTFTKTMPKSKLATEETIAMTHVWIKRSGELPLTLRLYVCSGGGSQTLYEALLNAITSYTSRWEHVEFRFVPSPIASLQLGNMPYLRTISMFAVPNDIQPPFDMCPKLARICDWYFGRTISSVHLPWHQLTHIRLSRPIPTREMFFVIQSCSKLTVLEVVLQDDVHESSSYEMVINRSLRELQLRVSEIRNPLLERLTLPALTNISFDLTFNQTPMPDFQGELMRFLSRSKCKLNRLVLEDCGLDDVELLECLEQDSCASLTDLRISNTDNGPMFTDAVLIPLTDIPSAENDVLLPKLTHLSLEFCFGGSPSRFGTMILSRRIPIHKQDQLRHLDIHYIKLDERDIYLLQLAESLGLEAKFDVEEE